MSQPMQQPNAALHDCEGRGWRSALDGALLVALAAATAAVVNVIVYGIASSLGAVDTSVNLVGETGLTPGLVAFASAIGVDLAAIAFLVVTHFSRQPVRRFRLVATIALLLSFVPVLSLPGASASMIVTLLTMHVVAWIVSITLIPRVARR